MRMHMLPCWLWQRDEPVTPAHPSANLSRNLKTVVLKVLAPVSNQKSIFRKKNHIASAAGKLRLPFCSGGACAGLLN